MLTCNDKCDMLIVLDKNNCIHIINSVAVAIDQFAEYTMNCGHKILGNWENKNIKLVGTYDTVVHRLRAGPNSDVTWCRKCGFSFTEVFK
jgi:hypothetical protein